ncbi:class I SAM-dependent methyltransferase [Paenibacillus terreus]|uniref:Class I SAM-dependent methyltransferase n=1 Tax=Paenibacillus terreus TaxID=1387834 RepID=A0ABV5BFY8_9BACL
MLQSLKALIDYRSGKTEALEEQEWLMLMASAEERIVNMERISSISELAEANPVLDYVERTLRRLDSLQLSFWIREILEEVLVWSETAKGGTVRQRLEWQEEGINLFVHNIGSAELYARCKPGGDQTRSRVIRTLIATHGLTGQYIRGEVPFAVHQPLTELVLEGLLSPEELYAVLLPLNECIIAAVDSSLWHKVRDEVEAVIRRVAWNTPSGWDVKERLKRLRGRSLQLGEDFDEEYDRLKEQLDIEQVFAPLQDKTLWFVESALQDFKLDEFIKIFLLIQHETGQMTKNGGNIRHISFEPLMNSMYYDYKGAKKVNVYKMRIIEKYLADLTPEQALVGEHVDNPHLTHAVERTSLLPDTVFFKFIFSAAAEKLIEFCIEAEKSPLYEKAVLLLFDLFGLRRDAYDRFHNEDAYLADMNRTADYKRVILDYVVGKNIVDIGPGGGVLLDLLERELPDTRPVGIDISANVIEVLERKKKLEGHRWHVIKGNALQLEHYLEPGSVDTVIFSSILHELYSYIERDGRKFNTETVADALRSAFRVLRPGGRVIIRDGIMTEPEQQLRRIRFLEPDGMQWLERYRNDFAGRPIQFTRISDHEVIMPVNDAMEFLYTYTWGEEAYVYEVQEQFGYFTPSSYVNFVRRTLGEQAEIIVDRHYLQEGYTEALSGRIEFMEESGDLSPLPDSTCVIVIQKKN